MLKLKTFRKFGLKADPFSGDVVKAEDVYLTEDTKFIAEYILQSVKAGGMIAIIGESGSGKTTIRRYAIDKMASENQKVRVITLRCVDKTRLSTNAICDAIISDCSAEMPRRTMEAKARQVERILTHSSRAGWNHVLMIEEAHDLNISTLKYLKRFWELEDGYKKLLSIVLIGQIEMKMKLDESKNWEAREVIRRMEILELEPLENGEEIAKYLDIKFNRIGKNRVDIINDSGCAALAARLRLQSKDKEIYSIAYPLLVNNWCKKAMNLACELGAKCVDAEVVNAL